MIERIDVVAETEAVLGRRGELDDSALKAVAVQAILLQTKLNELIDAWNAEHRARYRICDAYSKTIRTTIEADSPRDALAEFAIREGFADPRTLDEEESGLFEHDGRWHMTFTNTDLFAVELPR